MKKFLENNKKKLLILSLIILIIIVMFLFFWIIKNRNIQVNTISNDNYLLEYDNTWKIINQEEGKVKLVHKESKSELNINVKELDEEDKYKSVDELFYSLLYNIQEQNKEYKLIYYEKTVFTKNNIDGYEILFENDGTQSSIYFYKQGSKIVVITYEALYEYFDILLDSVNNIIYNFNIKEEEFDIMTNIKLELNQITYSEQNDIVEMLTETKEQEIASSNYLVNYSIPGNFTLQRYDTKYGEYEFSDLEIGKNIRLRTSILNCNIYEYLDKEHSPNLYDTYNLNLYNEKNEVLDKYEESPLSYIYRNQYLNNNEIVENIVIVYELNNSHIFIVKISSEKIGIPEELVKMIKINNIQNIASNIKIEKQGDFLLGNLKTFVDYKRDKTEEIVLKIPKGYKEVDKNSNLYEERNYVLNYDEDKQIYDYEVTYKIISFDIEAELNILDNSINKENGEYKEFKQKDILNINDKKFKIYERGYTSLSDENNKYYTNENVLFYQLENNKYLTIIIKANKEEINEDILSSLTKFDVNMI